MGSLGMDFVDFVLFALVLKVVVSQASQVSQVRESQARSGNAFLSRSVTQVHRLRDQPWPPSRLMGAMHPR